MILRSEVLHILSLFSLPTYVRPRSRLFHARAPRSWAKAQYSPKKAFIIWRITSPMFNRPSSIFHRLAKHILERRHSNPDSSLKASSARVLRFDSVVTLGLTRRVSQVRFQPAYSGYGRTLVTLYRISLPNMTMNDEYRWVSIEIITLRESSDQSIYPI